ncbi:MAG: YceI family protein [Ectothiorhodospiraceae bacterium]|nr:YceI family protein [Ectothiorhodospiraceae bacterium]
MGPITLLAGLLVLPLAAGETIQPAADPVCYRGTADNGAIRFHFRIERSEFIGRIGRFQAVYCMESGVPEQGEIRVTVDLTSVATGNRDLDMGIQEPEGFDVDRYPTAEWRTRSIEPDGDAYRISGELRLRGATRQEEGRFRLEEVADGWRLEGAATISRLDYDVGTGELADTDFIPDHVLVEFDLGLDRDP